MTRENIRSEMKEIFTDILEERAGDDYSASFIQLGGSSFDLTKLQVEIKKRFNEKLSYKELLNSNSLIEISDIIFERKNGANNAETDENESYEMTGMQRAVYMGRKEQMPLGGTASKTYFELICKEYDSDRFRKALRRIIETQESLRTIYDDDGKAVINNAFDPEIKENDISDKSESEKERIIEAVREELYGLEFNASKLPLFNIKISRLSDTEALIHFVYDGLISDGEGLELLISLFNNAYGGEELTVSACMKDYAQILESEKNSEEYKIAKKYWEKKISGDINRPELSVMTSDESVKKAESRQITRYLSQEEYDTFCDIAKQNTVTPFALLLTVFSKVIGRYSINKEFFINVPVSARKHELDGMDNTVALCSDIMYFRYDEIYEKSFADIALSVQEELMECKDNEAFRGTELMKLFREEYGAQNPAPVTFTSIISQGKKEKNRYFKKNYMRTHTAQTHIEMLVSEADEKIGFFMNYEKHIISKEIAQGIADTFFETICRIINDPGILGEKAQGIISEKDKTIIAQEALKDSGNYAPFVSVAERIADSIAKNGKETAIAFENGTVSYEELGIAANRISDEIKKVGDGNTKRVALLMQKSPQLVEAAVACVCAGIAYMPLETELPKDIIYECLKRTDINLVITDELFEGYFEDESDIKILNVDDKIFDMASDDNSVVDICKKEVDDEIVIINTSGTTGRPKSIALTQRGLSDCLIKTPEFFGLEEKAVVLALTGASHDLSLFDTLGILMYGGTIVMPDHKMRKEPSHWAALMSKYDVNVWNSVPAFMEMFMLLPEDEKKKAAKCLKTVIMGGDFISISLVKKVREAFCNAQIISIGGPSETTLWNIYHRVEDEDLDNNYIPYGKPFQGTSYYIFDRNMELTPIGVAGTMFVSGIGVSKGYIGNEEETKKRFIIHDGKFMYNTGDVGMYLPDGSIRIIGRDDLQVKINGKRIELAGIEEAIKECVEVQRLCVLPDEKNKLWAFYTSDEENDESIVKENLKKYLQDYMIPQKWMHLDEMPLTNNGKTDRKKLLEMTQSSDEDKEQGINIIKFDEKRTAGESEEEKNTSYDNAEIKSQLVEACREIMDDEDITEEDDFYSMGGDSISAMKLTAWIREEHNVVIDVFEILNSPEIEDWIEMIKERK